MSNSSLGTYERFRVDLHELGFHYNVSVVGVFSVPERSPSVSISNETLILQAVASTVAEHPNLRLQVRGSAPPRFVQLRELDVKKLVEFRESLLPPSAARDHVRLYLQDVLSDENSTPFTSPQNPLWRIICVDLGVGNVGEKRQTAIAFVYHHVIADGRSGVAVLASIRDALNRATAASPARGEGPGIGKTGFKVDTPPGEVSASMEELIVYHVTWKSRLRSLYAHYAPCLQRGSHLKIWTGHPFHLNGNDRAKTAIRLIELPASETARLRDKCNAHGTSITALLQVLVGNELFRQFPDAEALRCATALSLRRFFPRQLGIDDTKVGVWIDAFSYLYKREELREASQNAENLLWMAASQSKRRIDGILRKGLNDLSFASLQKSADFRAQLLSYLGKPRHNSYSITNLGVLEQCCPPQSVSKPEPWQLESVFFSQSAHINGSAVQFCIVSCAAGGMSISLNWQEGTVQDSDMDKVTARLQETLWRWSL